MGMGRPDSDWELYDTASHEPNVFGEIGALLSGAVNSIFPRLVPPPSHGPLRRQGALWPTEHERLLGPNRAAALRQDHGVLQRRLLERGGAWGV